MAQENKNNLVEALMSANLGKSKAELLEQWEKSKAYDSIGPTVKDFLSQCEPVLFIQSFNEEVPNELREMYNKVSLIAQQDTNDKFWSAKAIEHGVKGTHEDYNVIYNSDCVGHYFNTAQDALKAAKLQVKIYRINQERIKNFEYPNAEKWTSECEVPEWAKDNTAKQDLMIIKDNRIVSDTTFANRLKNFLNEIRVSDPMSEEELDYLRRVADRLLMHQLDTVVEQREKDYLIRCNLLQQ